MDQVRITCSILFSMTYNRASVAVSQSLQSFYKLLWFQPLRYNTGGRIDALTNLRMERRFTI